MLAIYLISLAGMLLSIYAAYVERKVSQDRNYRALCDISSKMSCSKTFTSGYGKMFLGISNGIIGIIFYAAIITLTYLGHMQIIFYLAAVSVLCSIYLAYALSFKVKTACIVCYSIYIINLVLFFITYKAYF
jgi:vitamin-K-epoxide reductase (warfarin-sensitive)